jgi:hypothetical protein
MLHKDRVWCLRALADASELVENLHRRCCTLCTGLRLGSYLFLNDATHEDGAQEFGVVKDLGGGQYLQLESWTVSWMTADRLREEVIDCLAGKLDELGLGGPVTPTIQTPQEHGRCQLCP